jgi:hypothetical protein
VCTFFVQFNEKIKIPLRNSSPPREGCPACPPWAERTGWVNSRKALTKDFMIKHKEQRVGVLVDASNMYHSARNLFKSHLNYKEVLDAAVAGRKLIRAIAYVVKTEGEEETPFFEALSQLGFEVNMKDLQIFPGGRAVSVDRKSVV